MQLQASNMRKNFIIFGTGKHALLVLNEITMEYITDQIFFFNDKEKKNFLKIGNKKYPIFKSFSKLNKKMKKNSYFFIAVGSNSLRKKIYDETKKKLKSCKILTIISKKSNIDKNVKIGQGTIILKGVSINSNTKVGKFCIINTNSSIDHDNTLGNFMSTGPGVNTGGNVRINDLCQIGIGASIKDKVTIKKNTIIGGGAFVNKNCDSNSTYFGVPAKKIKT